MERLRFVTDLGVTMSLPKSKTKYFNRYNALFAATYRNAGSIIVRLTETVLVVTSTNILSTGNMLRID